MQLQDHIDSLPSGSSFVLEMDKAAREGARTIAVLSPDYLMAIIQSPRGLHFQAGQSLPRSAMQIRTLTLAYCLEKVITHLMGLMTRPVEEVVLGIVCLLEREINAVRPQNCC